MANFFDAERAMYYVLDAEHNVVPLPRDHTGGFADTLMWGMQFENTAERIVAQTYVRRWFGTFWVSTVFLGLDHRFFGGGPPLLFETMVFDKTTGSSFRDIDMSRYSTWQEAEIGHQATVALVRAHHLSWREGLGLWRGRLRASWEQHLRNLGLPMLPEGEPRPIFEELQRIYDKAAS